MAGLGIKEVTASLELWNSWAEHGGFAHWHHHRRHEQARCLHIHVASPASATLWHGDRRAPSFQFRAVPTGNGRGSLLFSLLLIPAKKRQGRVLPEESAAATVWGQAHKTQFRRVPSVTLRGTLTLRCRFTQHVFHSFL